MTAASSERAILVGLDIKERSSKKFAPAFGAPETTPEESLDELAVLAASAGALVFQKVLQARSRIETATLIGSGKVDELALDVKANGIETVIFDYELTPTQQRNLERLLEVKVIDRTQLILDIFAHRARTREGQLQVELAQLNYMLPRLAGQGVMMSRLGGGIGARGPGETKLETDRRRIFVRKKKIEDDLSRVRTGRAVQRQQRQAVPLLTISLVGYTNAGKSTLFNRLTQAGVMADARMFATLDPTVRQLILPSRRRVLVSDTVGFIRNLPTTLVRAFRATLEEVTEAALLLHVVDVSAPQAPQQTAQVLKVLGEIGAEATPQLLVMNKADLAAGGPEEAERTMRLALSEMPLPQAVSISARTGEGVAALLDAIDAMLPSDPVSRATFRFPAGDGAIQHQLHEFARVIDTRYAGEDCEVEADAPASVIERLKEYLV